MSNDVICIVCPNGCHLSIEQGPMGPVVKGARCPKGEKYGIEELTRPVRVVTGVISTTSETWPCAPVKTTAAVPRDAIALLLTRLRQLRVELPVARGNVAPIDTGIDGVQVVFTRSLPPIQDRSL